MILKVIFFNPTTLNTYLKVQFNMLRAKNSDYNLRNLIENNMIFLNDLIFQ